MSLTGLSIVAGGLTWDSRDVLSRSQVLQKLQNWGYPLLPHFPLTRSKLASAVAALEVQEAAVTAQVEAAAKSAVAAAEGIASEADAAAAAEMQEGDVGEDEGEDEEEEEEEGGEEDDDGLFDAPGEIAGLVEEVEAWCEAQGLHKELQVFSVGGDDKVDPRGFAVGAGEAVMEALRLMREGEMGAGGVRVGRGGMGRGQEEQVG